MSVLVAIVAPFALTFAILELLRRAAWTARLADHPNERSLHATPTRRIGGIGVALAGLPCAGLLGGSGLAPLFFLAGALAFVSLVDDARGLPVWLRLAAHAGACGLAVFWIAPQDLGLGAVAVFALALAWMTNLYNFMDGADGLAGGMAVAGFGAFAIAASMAGQPLLALASAAIASSSAAFLAFNFPPARLFLGDSGSIPLGFLAGALGLHGAWNGAWPWSFPVLVFSPFIVDASFTLVRRLLRGRRVWRAHREHCYQRLVLSGWSPRRLATTAYLWMAAVASSALLLPAAGAMLQCGILLGWGVAYLGVLIVIDRRTAS